MKKLTRTNIFKALNFMALGCETTFNGHTVKKLRLADGFIYYIVDGDNPMTRETAADYCAA